MKGPFIEGVSAERQNNTKWLSAAEVVTPLASHSLYAWWLRVPRAQFILIRSKSWNLLLYKKRHLNPN